MTNVQNSDNLTNTNDTLDFGDYDITESFNIFNWKELGPLLIFYSLTFFLGLIGESEKQFIFLCNSI